jgi:hypothetical protein
VPSYVGGGGSVAGCPGRSASGCIVSLASGGVSGKGGSTGRSHGGLATGPIARRRDGVSRSFIVRMERLKAVEDALSAVGGPASEDPLVEALCRLGDRV